MKKLIGLLALILMTHVNAQDGVLEINQLCVETGCFQGDDPGFPVKVTNSGSYRLTSNITVNSANTTAIEAINLDSFTLDLNGFQISGVTECSGGIVECTNTGNGLGIHVTASKSVVIKNGTIVGLGASAISGNVFGPFTIENMIIQKNGGDAINAPSGAVVRNCDIHINGGNGFTSSSVTSLITGSRFINNGGMGVTGGACGGNVFRLNDGGEEECTLEISPNSCGNSLCTIN